MSAVIVIPPNFWDKSVFVKFQLVDQFKHPFPAEITDSSGWVAGAQSFSIGSEGGTISIPCNDELPSPPGETPQVGSFWLVTVQETNHQPSYHVQISSASPPVNWNELIEAGTPVDPADIWSGRLGPADAVAGQYQQFDGLGWQAVDPPAGTGDVSGPASAADGNLAVFDGITGKVIKDGGPPGGSADYMTKVVYDPQSISDDTFARANHTGTQFLASISDAGDSAGKNVGTGAGDVAAGDAPASSVAAHDASGSAHGSLIPSSDQKAALDANATLNAGNAVASINDIAVLEEDELVKVSATDTTAGYLRPKLQSGDGSIVISTINPGTDEIVDLQATGVGGGESNIGQNVGTGSQVYKGKNGVTLQFRTLLDTASINWTQSMDELSAVVPGGIFDPAGSSATVQSNLDTHTADIGNPHSVTAIQVGADPAGSAGAVQTNLDTHEGAVNNPHSVTAIQAGADPAGSASAVQGNLDTHTADLSNPHVVTQAQVGLGNADNTSDASKPVSTAQQAALDLKEDIANLKQGAYRDIGITSTDVAAGDLPGVVVAAHDSLGSAHNGALPTSDQKSALNGNATLNAGNPVASMADVGGGGPTNITITYTATTFDVESSSGTDGTVASAVAGGDAGALSGARASLIDSALQPSGSTLVNIGQTEQALGTVGSGTSVVDLSLGGVITATLSSAQIINFTNSPTVGYWTATINTQSNGVVWQAGGVAIDLPDGYDISGSPQRIEFSFVKTSLGVSVTERKIP